MAPGIALKRAADKVAPVVPPRGWFVLPAIVSIFIIFMQCTDVHADSYGMEEEEQDDTTRPPSQPDRLLSFDIARFGLLVGVIWLQLLLAVGNSLVASSLHEFVWPAWFFLAGIFGSSLRYESVAKLMCYSLTTNILLACIGTLFAVTSYHSEATPVGLVCGGSWILWCLLLYRMTITPLFHLARAIHVPVLVLPVLLHFGSYTLRSRMPTTNIDMDMQPHQIEHLLLMAKSTNALLHAGLLNAPYFAAGLLMRPADWNALLCGLWFRFAVMINGLLWFVLTLTPLLCSLGHWPCLERFWGVKLLIHEDTSASYSEDIFCYLTRMSASLVISCFLLTCASFLASWAPKTACYIGDCGSRIRYTLALFVLWYMIRPCILSPPNLPLQRSRGMSDLAMWCPALCFALVLTSAGMRQLLRFIIEPYWVKCFVEGVGNHLVGQVQDLKALASSPCRLEQLTACSGNIF